MLKNHQKNIKGLSLASTKQVSSLLSPKHAIHSMPVSPLTKSLPSNLTHCRFASTSTSGIAAESYEDYILEARTPKTPKNSGVSFFTSAEGDTLRDLRNTEQNAQTSLPVLEAFVPPKVQYGGYYSQKYGDMFEVNVRACIEKRSHVLNWKAGGGDQGIDLLVGFNEPNTLDEISDPILKAVMSDLCFVQCKFSIPQEGGTVKSSINKAVLEKLANSYLLLKQEHGHDVTCILAGNANLPIGIRSQFNELPFPALYLQVEEFDVSEDKSFLNSRDLSNAKVFANKKLKSILPETDRTHIEPITYCAVNIGDPSNKDLQGLLKDVFSKLTANESFKSLCDDFNITLDHEATLRNHYSLLKDGKNHLLKFPICVPSGISFEEVARSVGKLESFLTKKATRSSIKSERLQSGAGKGLYKLTFI